MAQHHDGQVKKIRKTGGHTAAVADGTLEQEPGRKHLRAADGTAVVTDKAGRAAKKNSTAGAAKHGSTAGAAKQYLAGLEAKKSKKKRKREDNPTSFEFEATGAGTVTATGTDVEDSRNAQRAKRKEKKANREATEIVQNQQGKKGAVENQAADTDGGESGGVDTVTKKQKKKVKKHKEKDGKQHQQQQESEKQNRGEKRKEQGQKQKKNVEKQKLQLQQAAEDQNEAENQNEQEHKQGKQDKQRKSREVVRQQLPDVVKLDGCNSSPSKPHNQTRPINRKLIVDLVDVPVSTGTAGEGSPSRSKSQVGAALITVDDLDQRKKKKEKKKKTTRAEGKEPVIDLAGDAEPAAVVATGNALQQSAMSVPHKKKKKAGAAALNHRSQPAASNDRAPEQKAQGTKVRGSSRPHVEAGSDDLDDAGQKLWVDDQARTDVKHGPFSTAEHETLLTAVREYAAAHNLSLEDLSWISNLRANKAKGAITAIAGVLPHRTRKAICNRLVRVLHPDSYKGAWTKEEDELLQQLVKEHGKKFTYIATLVHREPTSCRDRWRMICLEQKRHGRWSLEESARLQQLVEEHKELQQGLAQADEDNKKEKRAAGSENGLHDYRWLRDGINWNHIAERMQTRTFIQCMEHWYDVMAPCMITRGDWAMGDDRRLLRTLFNKGYMHDWEVDWNNIVEGRTAQTTRRRWLLMVKSVPQWREKELHEIVEYLVDTHMPHLKQVDDREVQEVGGGGGRQGGASGAQQDDGGEQHGSESEASSVVES